MAKIITFTNQKGGVGKTTSCVNLATYVASEVYKTLIVDMDPQGNASTGLGIADKNSSRDIYGVLTNQYKILDNVIRDTAMNCLQIIPTSANLAAAETELANQIDTRHRLLKDALSIIAADYDFIFIDCPPSLGILTINAITASDALIIPTQCEYYSLEGITQLLYTMEQIQEHINPAIKIEGILLTMYDKRSKFTVEIERELKKYFPDKVYKTLIPRNIRLAEAPSFGQPIMLYDKKCSGAKAYQKLASEFIKQNKGEIHGK